MKEGVHDYMLDYELIKKLYGIGELQGCLPEDMNYLKEKYQTIPEQLRIFFETAGGTTELNKVQDEWLFPDKYRMYTWMDKEIYKDYFVLLNENQGVFQVVIKRTDMSMDNPPVYVMDETNIVGKCADTLTEFLMGMLIYQSVFDMKYSPEDFFWYTDEEMQVIRKTMIMMPYKLHNWYSDTIEFYSNAEDNMLYVMDDGNQGTYGAMTSLSYQKIEEILGEMGKEQ